MPVLLFLILALMVLGGSWVLPLWGQDQTLLDALERENQYLLGKEKSLLRSLDGLTVVGTGPLRNEPVSEARASWVAPEAKIPPPGVFTRSLRGEQLRESFLEEERTDPLPEEVQGQGKDWDESYSRWLSDRRSNNWGHFRAFTAEHSHEVNPVETEEAAEPAVGIEQPVGRIYGGLAAVRAGPGPQHSIILVLASGASLRLARVTPHWVRVLTEQGVSGWVAANQVRRAGAAAADPMLAGAEADASDLNLAAEDEAALMPDEIASSDQLASEG